MSNLKTDLSVDQHCENKHENVSNVVNEVKFIWFCDHDCLIKTLFGVPSKFPQI